MEFTMTNNMQYENDVEFSYHLYKRPYVAETMEFFEHGYVYAIMDFFHDVTPEHIKEMKELAKIYGYEDIGIGELDSDSDAYNTYVTFGFKRKVNEPYEYKVWKKHKKQTNLKKKKSWKTCNDF